MYIARILFNNDAQQISKAHYDSGSVTYATDVVFECKNRSDKLCRGLKIPCKFTKKEHINYMGIFEIVNTKINVYTCVRAGSELKSIVLYFDSKNEKQK